MSEAHDKAPETAPEETLDETADAAAQDDELLADESPDGDDVADELDDAEDAEDAEDGDDDAEVELDDVEVEAEPGPPGSKAERRIRALAADRKALRQQLAERDAELERVRMLQWQPEMQTQPQRRDPAMEQRDLERDLADIAALPAPDQVAYLARLSQDQAQREMARHRHESADQFDRFKFELLARLDGIPRGYDAVVEEGLRRARAAGMNPSRLEILDLHLGRSYRENATALRAEQAERSRREVARHTVRSASYSSNASGNPYDRRRSQADIDDTILENTRMRDIK